MFSLGEVNIIENEKIILNDPLYNLLDRPNPFQTRRQFLWDFRFWNMLGCAYGIASSKVIQNNPYFYWLDASKIEFPQTLLNKLDHIIWSDDTIKKLDEEIVYYHLNDGTTVNYTLGEIKPFVDMSNGLGNWYGGPSRIDALCKIISNTEQALDAKGVNLHFSKKFMVAGKQDPANIYETPLTPQEKTSIERSNYSSNPVTAVKSMVDIKRYVSDMASLKLDESYESDLLAIGSMYGIPKEMLDALKKGSTYENQEKALVRHISYTVQPKANDLGSGLEVYFGYDLAKKDLTITYDHLPAMQNAAEDKAQVFKTNAETLSIMIASGVDREDAALYLGMDIKFVKNEITDTEVAADS